METGRKAAEAMIEDKATERWKERMKRLGLIVNMGADKAKSKPETNAKDGKAKIKPGRKDVKK